MKRLFGILLLTVIITAAQAQETLREFALFDYNSYELTPQTKSMIDTMLKEIGASKITKVELYGHSDSKGDESGNLLLSQNRVNAVQTYLLSLGIDKSIIVTDYYGEKSPAYPNETEAGMQKNRRVEIAFTYEIPKKEEVVPVAEVPPVRTTPPTPIRSVPVTNTNVQRFTVSAKNTIEITGAKGTHLIFPEKCFVDSSGKGVTGEITIELIEVYTKSEMINQNLSTMSGTRLIESAGMAYVRVLKGNQNLELASYTKFTIEFPAPQGKESGMILFSGDTSSGNLNWIPQNTISKGKSDWDYVNQQTLDKYVFNSGKLGWVNCDHFLTDFDVTDMFVDVADTTGVSFCLVFKSYNSIMNPDSKDQGTKFRNVPIGEVVTVVAFRKTETGALYASEDVTIEKNFRTTVVMSALTEAEFQERIKQFD